MFAASRTILTLFLQQPAVFMQRRLIIAGCQPFANKLTQTPPFQRLTSRLYSVATPVHTEVYVQRN